LFFVFFISSLIIMTVIVLIPTISKITLIYKKEPRIEITVALLKIELYSFSDSKGGTSAALITRIISKIVKMLGFSKLTLEELCIPLVKAERPSIPNIFLKYGYRGAIASFIAYLNAVSEKLNIRDNAVILVPDSEEGFSLRLSARVPIFYVVRTVLNILADKRSIEKEKEKRNVGN